MAEVKHIVIAGAGPVGSLLSIYLRRRGYRVTLLERRPDMRNNLLDTGRSINMALSNRGLKPLKELDLMEKVEEMVIPMKGRMIHDLEGITNLQPYGKEGQAINSISRAGLNMLLLDAAEAEGCEIVFDCKVNDIDLANTRVVAEKAGRVTYFDPDLIVGSDGAFSAVRSVYQKTDRFDYSQFYLNHGYKELSIPPGEGKTFKMEKNALHIWPRGKFMLIALPNLDGSFTCTLFFPFEGQHSFQSLSSFDKVQDFFSKTFPDALEYMSDLEKEFNDNPTSSLVTVRCFPWVRNKTLLIGDAAHAVVPFYGQGMNCGFEDCRVLNDLLNEHKDNWTDVLPAYQELRKPDGDAISELALKNFIEMRDLVADDRFILQKKIEKELNERYPNEWIPLYSMVTFNEDIRYSDALRLGNRQQEIMDEVLNANGSLKNPEDLDLETIIGKLK